MNTKKFDPKAEVIFVSKKDLNEIKAGDVPPSILECGHNPAFVLSCGDLCN